MVLEPPGAGEVCPEDELEAPLALALLRHLRSGGNPDVALVETRRGDTSDTVVLDVGAEVPSHPVHDIRPVERIALEFDRLGERMPRAWALREDFPLVPHLVLERVEKPRSLCLYEEAYETLRFKLTAPGLLRRVQEWLKLAARGELHPDDQPLEPLLVGTAGILIVDPGLLFEGDKAVPISVTGVQYGKLPPVFFANSEGTKHASTVDVLGVTLRCNPQPHGIIRWAPQTLHDLQQMMLPGGTDLLALLRQELQSVHGQNDRYGHRLLLLCILPVTRTEGGPVERLELRAFLAAASVAEVGRDIGLWGEAPGGGLGLLLPGGETPKDPGKGVGLGSLDVVHRLDRDRAAQYSGLELRSVPKIAAVGVGALGSQLAMNLIRCGIGEWTLIDADTFLPHNAARHALSGAFAGVPKALALACEMNESVRERPGVARPILADVLVRGEASEEAHSALAEADLILDASASVPVARYLAVDVGGGARRVSTFLSPSGMDLVVLAEDADRTVRLDHLEVQYYQHLVDNPDLADHLRGVGRVRYGISCRDVSSQVPQDAVALHAATASRVVKRLLDDSSAQALVWRIADEDWTTRRLSLQVVPMHRVEHGGWTLHVSPGVEREARRLRELALPDETGGTLVGSYDLHRKIAYVTGLLPSPGDSRGYPDSYIRGSEGLKEHYAEIGRVTAGMLEYVGEWHSHPRSHGVEPSDQDRVFFGWLKELMGADGLPPLMAIVSDGGIGWYIDELE